MSHKPLFIALGFVIVAAAGISAQRGAVAPPPASARDAAPIDLTGTWVSVVTEDWRWRMMTPAKGDYMGVPLTPQGRKVADSWDLARDNSEGNQCRPYGVGNIMRVRVGSESPGRMRIPSGWISTRVHRRDFFASEARCKGMSHGRVARRRRGSSPLGDEELRRAPRARVI